MKNKMPQNGSQVEQDCENILNNNRNLVESYFQDQHFVGSYFPDTCSVIDTAIVSQLRAPVWPAKFLGACEMHQSPIQKFI